MLCSPGVGMSWISSWALAWGTRRSLGSSFSVGSMILFRADKAKSGCDSLSKPAEIGAHVAFPALGVPACAAAPIPSIRYRGLSNVQRRVVAKAVINRGGQGVEDRRRQLVGCRCPGAGERRELGGGEGVEKQLNTVGEVEASRGGGGGVGGGSGEGHSTTRSRIGTGGGDGAGRRGGIVVEELAGIGLGLAGRHGVCRYFESRRSGRWLRHGRTARL